MQRVLLPVTDAESWTLLGDDGAVVEPADQYLAYLTAIERSPNTVRAYAFSLKLWFEFLSDAGIGWRQAGVEDVARFVGWLRAPAANVIVLGDGTGARAAATVNTAGPRSRAVVVLPQGVMLARTALVNDLGVNRAHPEFVAV